MTSVILHVITGLGSGGAEGMLARLLLHYQSRGTEFRHIVISLLDDGIYGARLRAAGIEVHCLHMRRGRPSIRSALQLARLIRARRPDVIMTWLFHADFLGSLASLIAGVGTSRLLWNLRAADINFAHYTPSTRWIIRLLAGFSRFPAAVAVNSNAGRRFHERLGYRPKRWAYLPNGFDLDAYRPDASDRAQVRGEWGLQEDAIAIGMVARVDPQKDHAAFLAAAEQAATQDSRLRFVLIGKGTEALSVPDGLLGRVLALGERVDVARLLRGLDIAALPSASGEGFPNAVGEAMASGLPVIVTDVGDAGSLVGDTGIVITSPSNLLSAILRLSRETAEERRRRGVAARNSIEAKYSLPHVAAQFEKLWLSILQPNTDNH